MKHNADGEEGRKEYDLDDEPLSLTHAPILQLVSAFGYIRFKRLRAVQTHLLNAYSTFTQFRLF